MTRDATLRLRLLGELELRRGEQRLALPQSRKTKALLAYLVLAGQPQRRTRLCELLWDVADDPRGALRWCLTKLRPLLDDPGRPRLLATRETVAIDPGGLEVDRLRLREAAADPDALATPALAALAAASDGVFLDGLELADLHEFHLWCLAERGAAHRDLVALLEALVARLADAPEQALPHARRVVELEPLDEAARARLVELLTATGRRDEAAQQLEVGSRLLAEHGVAPTGALSIAAWQARRGPGTPGPAAATARQADAPAAPRPPLRVPRAARRLPAPRTRYAKSGGLSIAYQVVGEGPDLILAPGWVSHVEHVWEDPTYARFLHRLRAFCRLILFDRRGTGLSDPVHRLPTLEERMDDVRAVLDAAGAPRATLFGLSEGGPLSMLFAATYPERTAALVLYGTFARGAAAPDYPWGWVPEQITQALDFIGREWGTGKASSVLAPSLAEDRLLLEGWGRFERLAVSPGQAEMMFRMMLAADVRHVLPAIRTPTLVLHRRDDAVFLAGGAAWIAEHIAGARYVELPGADHFLWVGNWERIADLVEEFVTGARPAPVIDRVLATVLFVDIVGSTARLAAIGDRAWRDLLERHQALVRGELARCRGREVNTAGDAFLATFDGPARAIACARAIVAGVRELGLEVRAGLHSGECELLDGDVAGIAVHIGARVADAAAPGEVLVSSTVKDLVAGSPLRFTSRGAHTLAGVPGEWTLYRVEPDEAAPRP